MLITVCSGIKMPDDSIKECRMVRWNGKWGLMKDFRWTGFVSHSLCPECLKVFKSQVKEEMSDTNTSNSRRV